MPFQELDDFFDDTLEIPIRGKVYRIPSPDAETGLWCERVVQLGMQNNLTKDQRDKMKLDDDDERDLYDRVLGSVKQEMIDDGLSWARVSAVAQTAIVWVATDRSTAEKYWNERVVGGGPKAPEPKQPQDHKPKQSSQAPSRAGSGRRSSKPAPEVSDGTDSSNTGS